MWLFSGVSIRPIVSFFAVPSSRNIVLILERLQAPTLSLQSSTMYLLSTYPFLSNYRQLGMLKRSSVMLACELDFVTPEGYVVPRALGEAALRCHTAVLVGGLLVGGWAKSA
jgi:hypothetical protein